jgi:hypothetical protein
MTNRSSVVPSEVERGGRLVDEHEGAKILGISFWTCRQYVEAGILPAVEFPSPLNPRRKLRRKLIDVRDLDAFIAKHKRGGAQ